MVRRLLQLPGAPSPDAADALACAICHAHGSVGIGALRGAGGYDAPRAPRAMKARRPARRPVAVIFDMDGLMLDTESLGRATLARRGRGASASTFDLDLLPSMIGRNYRDCRAILREHYGADYPVEQLHGALARRVRRDRRARRHRA